MAVPSVAKPVVVFFEVGVAQHGSAGPMMESVIEGQRASSPHEDSWSQLTALAAFFCDGGDAAESPGYLSRKLCPGGRRTTEIVVV